MSLLQPYFDHLKMLESKLPEVAKQAIVQNKDLIVNILKDRQLSQGLGYSGDITFGGRTTYSKKTQDYYAKKFNPRKPKIAGAKYNMEWSGEFFDTLGIKVKTNEYDIFSSTGKDTFLEGIFGGGELTKFREENNKYVNENIILPALQKFIIENAFSV